MRTGTLGLHALAVMVWTAGLGVTPRLMAEPLDSGPVLSQPVQDLDRLLPHSVIDSLEVPEKPVRVAARPTLNWAPGLKKAAENTQEPATQAAEAPALSAPTQPEADQPGSDRSADEPVEAPKAFATDEPEADAAPVFVAPRLERPERATAPEGTKPEETKEAKPAEPESQPETESEQQPEPAAPATEQAEQPAEAEPTESEAVKEPAIFIAPESPKAIKPARPTTRVPEAEQAAPKREPKPQAQPEPGAKPEPKPRSAPKASPKRTEPAESAAPARESVAPKKRPPAQPKATTPPVPLSRGLRSLRSRMRTVLSFYYRKPLNTVEHDPWEIMHSMLSYELHSRVHNGGPGSPYMTAIGHLCFNRPAKRQRLMRVNEEGLLEAKVGVGVQGHKGQFLAMLAQCNVSPDYPIRAEGDAFTIRDLIHAEQLSCESKTELTFKLIGLGHYLDSDAEWLDERGERWDFPRLIREERAQPIRGAACGGTHRLAGLSLAFRRREARGEPLDGEYAEAARFVAKYQGYAFRLQNDDGSLSTEWFRGPGAEESIDRRLRTTGHLLEWLVYSLPDDQLRSHRMVRAVNYLTNLLASNADHEWHLGSIAHGLHALVLYDKRVFRPHDKQPAGQLAAVDPTGRLFRDYPIYRGVMRNSPPERGGLFQGLFGNPRTSGSSKQRR